MPFPDALGGITCFLKNLSQGNLPGSNPDVINPCIGGWIPDHSVTQGETTGEQSSPGGCTIRSGHIKIAAAHPILCQLIDVRSFISLLPIAGNIPVTQIVDIDQDKIRRFGFGFFLDNQLAIKHLPPPKSHPIWKRLREDIYRFVYEQAKINNQKDRIGMTRVYPEDFDPYPGCFLKKDINDKIVNFVIIYEDEAGKKYVSEVFDFDLPYEPEIKEGSDFLQVCLFGGAIFLLPYPNLVLQKGESFFSLTKEIPIISFRSKSRRYPAGYLSLEYSYIFDAAAKNYLRAGYKQLYELPYIEYLSSGVSLYTNFLGNNGIGIEASLGLFTIVDTFTLYTRYRFNIKMGDSPGNFHEISLGLYSSFFSFYLN